MGFPNYDPSNCSSVQTAWFTCRFHDNNPISNAQNEFNNDSCLPWDNYTCSGEGYPIYVINATTAEHVKLGVDFGTLPRSRK